MYLGVSDTGGSWFERQAPYIPAARLQLMSVVGRELSFHMNHVIGVGKVAVSHRQRCIDIVSISSRHNR